MISFKVSGSTESTERYLRSKQKMNLGSILAKYGAQGVAALRAATPKDSGLTAASWTYKIDKNRNGFSISWHNTDIESGFPVAIMLQYGYSTGTGGYVAGLDYINPAMKPVFDRIADQVWKEVTRG